MKISKGTDITFIGTSEHTYRPIVHFLKSNWDNKILPLDQIRDDAEHLLFWGTNPAETHPRYMSRYTVFPRGKKTPNGRESRTLATFDIRYTPTSQISNHHFTMTPKMDVTYLTTLAKALGKPPKEFDLATITKKDMDSFRSLTKSLQQSQLVLLCIGGGLLTPQFYNQNVQAVNSLCLALEEKGIP